MTTRRSIRIPCGLMVLAFAVGCASESPSPAGPERVCVPGTTQGCICPTGGDGVQSCEEAGTGYTTCNCIPTTDAGGSGGADASGVDDADGSGGGDASESGGSGGAPATGQIGPWSTTTNLPTSLSGGGAAVVNGYAYVLGHSNAGAFFASVQADGTIGTWRPLAAQPNGFDDPDKPMPVVSGKGKLYVATGTELHGTTWSVGTPGVDGDVISWESLEPPAAVLTAPAMAIAGSHLYLAADADHADADAVVWWGQLNGDGKVTGWEGPVSLSPPEPTRAIVGAHVIQDYLYVVYANYKQPDGSGTGRADIDYCKISADGSVESCSDTTSSPPSCSDSIYEPPKYSGAANGFLYIGSVRSWCFADLHADGVVGTWTNTSPTPQEVNRGQFTMTDSHAFLISGYGITTSYVASLW